MYYINRDGIERRLDCLPELAGALDELSAGWRGTTLQGLAQERCLHLAAEIVTDVGSALIDGFLMRDASSYEDIVDIISGEGVLPAERAEPLKRLVTMRRTLVQEYDVWPRGELHALSAALPALLAAFAADVRAYLDREAAAWSAGGVRTGDGGPSRTDG